MGVTAEEDDEAKKQKFVENVIDLQSKGVPNPGVTTKAQGPELASPSGDVAMQQPTSIGGQAVKQYGYQPTPARGPEQTITTPGGYRPATQQDYKDAALQNEQLSPNDYLKPSPYDEAYAQAAGKLEGSIPKSNGIPAYVTLAAKYKEANPTSSQADIISYVAQQYPESTYDRNFLNSLIKTSDKGVAIKNSDTAVIRAGIAQQNANTNANRASAQTGTVAGTDLNSKQLKERNRWQQGIQKNYEAATTSTRSGTNLQAASNAFETVNKTLDAPQISAAEVTGVKDQIAKLLNPGFAISKVQFAHLNNGGLVDEVKNWVQNLTGNDVLTTKQREQYRTLVTRLGEELVTAHKNIKDDYWTQAHKLSTQNGWSENDSISLTPKAFSFDNPEPSSGSGIPGVITTELGNSTGNKKQKWGVDANGMPTPLEN